MEIIKNLHDVKKYLEGKCAHFSCEETAQAVRDYSNYNKRKLEVNMSTAFSQLIREAARCNRYNSDVVYDINAINNAFEDFRPFYPDPEFDLPFFVLGFRRDGVDGNSFIKSRMEGRPGYDLYKEYFAIYFVEVKEDEEDYENFFKVEVKGYNL